MIVTNKVEPQNPHDVTYNDELAVNQENLYEALKKFNDDEDSSFTQVHCIIYTG